MTESTEDNTRLNENDTNMEFATPEKQEARAFLRERFLRVITGIVGKQAEFHLYENTQVSAEFRGCDVDCLEIYVRNLETPLGKIPEAVLRASDTIYLDVNEINSTR
ncbi:PREDICTED: gem-associated protein 7-like isoform X3 [Eufriesea mexicana]|uniref:gem-associated protein 7-like isoform X3 n=1 Tax=Eufriesea mexicana TaxID=516756 RepID=UPI00083C1EA7|nr:PREDICTED: gem-associated protein 7-like isoform X3 [Eufriesea mexicana]XP_017758527.1 PREDICTED: gem-associated protein 7-like isoform X3 [Eufriesea mexicana]XP_017758528.1 PREDICTED: gem-associated protein 7-like isoform X3 [Eufriesea mexicana]XP_017758529.1 PREDICTED: gem-associated protein 7-like isoform X3 [Eufriesea mexicana]